MTSRSWANNVHKQNVSSTFVITFLNYWNCMDAVPLLQERSLSPASLVGWFPWPTSLSVCGRAWWIWFKRRLSISLKLCNIVSCKAWNTMPTVYKKSFIQKLGKRNKNEELNVRSLFFLVCKYGILLMKTHFHLK